MPGHYDKPKGPIKKGQKGSRGQMMQAASSAHQEEKRKHNANLFRDHMDPPKTPKLKGGTKKIPKSK